MLIGSEKNDVIPCLPYHKDFNGIQYEKFVDHKSKKSSDKLPLPSTEYWHTLEDVLTQYVRHNNNKFDYDNEGIAHRKHIVADGIRYIGKETNNINETQITRIEVTDYLEYENLREFYDWVLTLKPKDVRDMGISKQDLSYARNQIKNGIGLKKKTKLIKELIPMYKSKEGT